MDMDIKVTLKMVEEFNQETPEARPSRNQLLQQKLAKLEKKANGISTTTFLTGDSHSCKTPFEQLKSIKLCDMKVPMVHTDRYLICKIKRKLYPVFGIAKPSPVIGVHTVIEDLNGDLEEAGIYNFRVKLDDPDWLSPGTILVIKEPRLQYCTKNKTPSLRIDSPTDVIFVDPADEKLLDEIGALQWYEKVSKDAEVWKQEANACFKNEKYEKALFLYDRGIRCDPDLAVLHLNKSLTCLRMGDYYDAYEAAKLGLEKGGDREKALCRMGQAAYGMREWKQAADHFLAALKEFPKSVIAAEQLKRATARLAEQKTGKYDFKGMYESIYDGEKLTEKLDFDVADFTGPIEIVDIPGKGRGIIASKDIKEGTLLAVCKPFASGYRQDFPKNLNNLLTKGQCILPEHILQVIDAMQKLQDNPKLAGEVYKLYAGDDVPYEEIPFGVIDAARIQRISCNNPFISDDLYPDDSTGLLDNRNSLLFILPSYFNHSCLANAFRTFYGDVIAIHAIADIKKGEEICLTYLYPLKSFAERKCTIMARGFTCQCKLCKLDAADPFCETRDQMLEEMKYYKKTTSPQNEIANGEPILKKIRETYVNRKELKVVLAQALVILGSAYYRSGNPSKTIKYLEEVLTLMNNPLKHSLRMPDICVNLGTCYLNTMNIKKFKEMIRKSMELCFTSDMGHFKMLYPEISSCLKLLGTS